MFFRRKQQQKQRLQKLKKQHIQRLSKNSTGSKPQNIDKTVKERPRSWSTESEASSSENDMDTGDKRARDKSGELDFQAELEKTRQLIVRSKSKENTESRMEDEQNEGLKEGRSMEALPEDKENMDDSGMNDLLDEESNVVDIPLGD